MPVLAYLGSLGSWYMLDEMLDFFKVYASHHADARFLFITPDRAAPHPRGRRGSRGRSGQADHPSRHSRGGAATAGRGRSRHFLHQAGLFQDRELADQNGRDARASACRS